jgi:hypothetical protein
MNDTFEWFVFVAGVGVGIGVSLAAFIAVLFLSR